MEKSVWFSASREQFSSYTKPFWQTFIVTPWVLLQYFCSLSITISIHWVIFCTCLIFIAYLKFTEPKTHTNDSWNLALSCCDFENPLIQICSQITACQAFIAGLIHFMAFLMYEVLCFTVYLLVWVCCVELNAYAVQTGPRWRLGLILKHFKHYYPKLFLLMKSWKSRKQKPLSLENRILGKNRGSALASWLAKEHQQGTCWCKAHGDLRTPSFSHQAGIGAGCPGLENEIKSYWNYFVYKMPFAKIWESILRGNWLLIGSLPALFNDWFLLLFKGY